MPRSAWPILSLAAVALALGAALVSWLDHPDLDERIPLRRGGRLVVDVALGGGVSLDPGSLAIRSHADDAVHVSAHTSGWGQYAVALELSQQDDRVDLVGRVEGPLYWIFGGPSVELEIAVPRGVAVEARFVGGPLRVEDVEGEVTLRSDDGDVEVDGVRGALRVTALHGRVEIASVEGPVRVGSAGGRLHGSIEIEDVTGPVQVESRSGQIELAQIAGPVSAHCERCSIEVEFAQAPSGELETQRGSIDVRVPRGAGFDLDARAERGRVRVDGDGGAEDETLRGRDEVALVRAIHGGGAPLRLRTARGSIRVER